VERATGRSVGILLIPFSRQLPLEAMQPTKRFVAPITVTKQAGADTIGHALLEETRKQTLAASQMTEGTDNITFNLEVLRTEISSSSRWLAWIFWSNVAIIAVLIVIIATLYLRLR
jgi:hypothetical protein